MDRLTVPDERVDGGLRRAIIDAREVRKEAMTIYWRLKKYEDTGLAPEEIMEGKLLTGWIPVSERLPEDNAAYYLVTSERSCRVEIAWYLQGVWYWYNSPAVIQNIIAWMPIPERYSGC